jgi:hypothetical protein
MNITTLKRAAVVECELQNGVVLTRETKHLRVSETASLSDNDIRLVVVDLATIEKGVISWWGPLARPVCLDTPYNNLDSVQKL